MGTIRERNQRRKSLRSKGGCIIFIRRWENLSCELFIRFCLGIPKGQVSVYKLINDEWSEVATSYLIALKVGYFGYTTKWSSDGKILAIGSSINRM